MKICVYCKTENRTEAIFCPHCRRPLPTRPHPPRIAFVWFFGILGLIGLGAYLFSSVPGPLAVQPSTPIADDATSSNRIRDAVALHTCAGTNLRIRRHPGTHSETIGGIFMGDCLTILGRTQDASWVYVVSDDYHTGWVASSLVTDAGDISKVSIRDESAWANPARPTLTSLEFASGVQIDLTEPAETQMSPSLISSYVVPCVATADRLGDYVTCRVETAYCDYLPEMESSPTVCNDRPRPDQAFALVARDRDWKDYDGHCLIISGYLELDRGILLIQAFDRDQVSSCSN